MFLEECTEEVDVLSEDGRCEIDGSFREEGRSSVATLAIEFVRDGTEC